jgi:hypothetical protein
MPKRPTSALIGYSDPILILSQRLRSERGGMRMKGEGNMSTVKEEGEAV